MDTFKYDVSHLEGGKIDLLTEGFITFLSQNMYFLVIFELPFNQLLNIILISVMSMFFYDG